jgi:CDP-6-deoxy-D-xylo-4-hexulose-3-dehydrase
MPTSSPTTAKSGSDVSVGGVHIGLDRKIELASMFRIPLNKNTLGREEIDAAKAVLDSGQLTMGDRCLAFERAFADYLGVKHAIMVNSGSSANLLAMFALANPLVPMGEGLPPRIAPGSEIIVPALTWSTTVWPVLQIGATPVFVDCDPGTLQMQPEAITAAITQKTAAIVVVHVLGGAVNIAEVCSIAKKHGLWLFEDTCESLGVLWEGKPVGSFGHAASFSFFFSHHITTIEGGMVVTDDGRLAELLRVMRAHGWTRNMDKPNEVARRYPDVNARFLFVTTGFNLRPMEINAALGLRQLDRLNGFNETRRRNAQRLDRELADLDQSEQLSLIRHDPRVTPAPLGYTVLCQSRDMRDRLVGHLESSGIETRPVICGNLTRQPALAHFCYKTSGDLTGADRVMDCGLYWGSHPGMTDDDIDYVAATVKAYF